MIYMFANSLHSHIFDMCTETWFTSRISREVKWSFLTGNVADADVNIIGSLFPNVRVYELVK